MSTCTCNAEMRRLEGRSASASVVSKAPLIHDMSCPDYLGCRPAGEAKSKGAYFPNPDCPRCGGDGHHLGLGYGPDCNACWAYADAMFNGREYHPPVRRYTAKQHWEGKSRVPVSSGTPGSPEQVAQALHVFEAATERYQWDGYERLTLREWKVLMAHARRMLLGQR